MRIQRINQIFAIFAQWQLRYRYPLIVLTLLVTIWGIAGLRYVKISNSREQWFDNTEAIEIATEKFEDQFGNNDNIGILVEAKDVFDPEVLRMIQALGQELIDSVPYADEITSLAEMEISVGNEEGIQVINPFENGIPDDPQRIEEIRKLVLSRQALAGKIVSEDCTETWIMFSLLEYPEESEWKKRTNKDPMFEVGEAAMRIVTHPKWKSDLYTIKASGMPYTETEERDFFGPEAMKRVGSGFIMMIILLAVFLRSLRGVFVPIFTTIVGIVLVFGTMGWLDIRVDANLMTLPILLGMALSVGYSIHLVNAFKRFFDFSGKRKEALIAAVEETGWPIFFTAMTTIGSVLSFISAGILTIKWLGFTCAAVVLADYLFVIILIPALMSFGKDKPVLDQKKMTSSFFNELFKRLGLLAIRRKGFLLAFFVLCVVGLTPGIRDMSVNMDSFKFMGLKIPYIQRLYEIVHSQLGSYMSYNITIDYEHPDAIKDPQILEKFEDLLDTVSTFELTKKNENAVSIFSILDIIKEMNQTLHGDSLSYHKIPETKELIAQVLFLYEMSGGTKTFKWIDEEYSMLRAQVQIPRFDANEIVRELNLIEQIGQQSFPGAKINIVGSAVQFAELNKKIVTGELKSIFWALVIIGLLLVVVFGSLKTGIIGMIPNISPLIFIGGYMGYFDSPLDMMTMTIMPMLLGIAVDDTIHFINHIQYEFEKCGDYETAILTSFQTVGKTLAMTTIVLSVTFAMYMLSPVANMVRIGLLASLGLMVALFTDYLITPALIMITKPFGKKNDG